MPHPTLTPGHCFANADAELAGARMLARRSSKLNEQILWAERAITQKRYEAAARQASIALTYCSQKTNPDIIRHLSNAVVWIGKGLGREVS